MKVRIATGAELDFLTKDELRKELEDFRSSMMQERRRGMKHPRFTASGTITGGNLIIGGPTAINPTQERLGPTPGFCWSVQRLKISGLTGSDAVTVYINEVAPSMTVQSGITAATGFCPYGRKTLVLMSSDELVIAGTGLTGTGKITVSGQATEVPEFLQWTL